MDTKKLENFLTVAQYLTITDSSKSLYLSQPTLSRQISSLERELGIKLFERHQFGVTLTDEGETVLKEVQKIVSSLENLSYLKNHPTHKTTGKVSIGCPFFICANMLTSILNRFKQEYPNIEILLYNGHIGSLLYRIKRKSLDIAIISENDPEAFSSLSKFTLKEDNICVGMAKNHKLAKNESVSFEDLKDESIFWLSKTVENFNANRIHSLCAKNNFYQDNNYFFDDIHTMLIMVGAGYGIAFIEQGQITVDLIARIPLNCISEDTRVNRSVIWDPNNENSACHLLADFIRVNSFLF